MSEYSMVSDIIQMGGHLSACVDVATGEQLYHAAPVNSVMGDGRPGLSKSHICTSEGQTTFYLGGSLITCKKPPSADPFVVKGGGPRGKIKAFSASSRRRMLYTMGKIQRAKLPMFITLTYPAEFPTEGVIWKNHLRRWFQRLRRRVPGVGCVWKLEPQKRGAPHFHLMFWGLGGVPLLELRAWVSKSWYQVVGSGDTKHLQAGTQVEYVRNSRGVMAYAGKYLGKVIDGEEFGWDEPGRFWGIKGGENIPWADLITCSVTMRQAVRLLRYMRRYMRCRRAGLPSLTMLCTDPEYWFDRLDALIT